MDPKKIHSLVAEKDQRVSDLILSELQTRDFVIDIATNKEDVFYILKNKLCHLAFIGEVEGRESPYETMKEVVIASPMTSIILITNLPEEDVLEKAEGYGILGHIPRTVPSNDLEALLKSFEQITQSLRIRKE